MSFKIALAGNPNCGKTTIFNELTGSSQYVGNWPGVTVEKKEGRLKGYKDTVIVDLPGIYSLSPYTLEEVVSRNYIINEKPDVIINIVDSSNIERNLYLTTQLMETNIPVIIALNMIDVLQKSGDTLDTAKLSEKLGCTIIETSAVNGKGIKELGERAVELAKNKNISLSQIKFDERTEQAIFEISSVIGDSISENLRWHAVKLFEKDKIITENLADEAKTAKIASIIEACEKELDDDSESIITNLRYEYISSVLNGVYKKKHRSGGTVSDKIDRIVTNRWLALPIFFIVMWGIYFISIQSLGDITIGWIEVLFGDVIGANVQAYLEGIGAAQWLIGLIVDGIINGVGSVLVFVPQLMILFFFLSLLEDCGYMARVAFIMDRIFRNFGLSGKSFIPMLIGTGCSVPGIMASRTIENERDRKMTIMLIPFIPCGAKLPVFALIAGAIFPQSSFVAPSMYFIGILMVIICGILLKRTKLFKGDPAPFVMELPRYMLPRIKSVIIHMWDRGKSFIIKAGTIIFAASGLIWLLQNFSWSFQMVEPEYSILASIGKILAPIFAPLGFGNWQSAVATVSGYLAKENIVATFGILFGLGSEVTESSPDLLSQVATLFGNPIAAYSFMAFTLFAPPCFAAIGAIRREMNSAKWTWITIGFQTGVAYISSFLIFQIGSLIAGYGTNISTYVIAAAVLGIIALIIYRKIKNRNKGCCGNCSGCTGCK